jgi:RNA polymerase sigma-70 factor (ECF subfamily)
MVRIGLFGISICVADQKIDTNIDAHGFYARFGRNEPCFLEEIAVRCYNRRMVTRTRATLLERLRDGADALAWDEFFAYYWPTIYGFARHRGCSPHTAEEIVQEVMLKVFERRHVYQYDSARGRFRDWLGTVVRHQVAEYRRRPANRLRGVGGDAEGDLLEQVDDEQGPDAAWEDAFEGSVLLAILDVVRRETNPRTYLAFELIGLQGLSGREVARATGLSRNAVYKAHKRVLQRLTELSGPYREEGRLVQRIKQAMELRPPAAEERSLTTRIQKTMSSR